ncbi:protein MpDIR36 [Marchantia polymorpha subsp. ruderalis]|uniref:Dirigent protein n=2 Tax=Marchantia polymorpha TaxID=3197 RepID=A0AAF6BJ43_MARPO|nr:hypothetical protein MARPO_0117s0017 [Marchantia polymorpha]BBN12027.1 hypothetical protein Mp_5g16890 [Marchantia polymorpha subsp. ruderalis]|eukprot:PTQ30956.1 hypothetical protein MARPO_0117s0017 [Marchantia polymorpha]
MFRMAGMSVQLRACTCLLMVAISISESGAAVDAKKVKKLEFYLHEQFISEPGYPATDVLAASATGNTSTYAFGNLGISEQVIRDGVSNVSTIIGRAPGTFQPNKQERTFALYKLLTLQTKEWNGTLVVFSDWISDAPSNEWTVVGGTGTFRMMRGYAINTKADGSAQTAFITFKWEVFLTPY